MSEIVLLPGKPIKLVIWDLDDALWSGADGTAAAALLRRDTRALITALDDRGVLQSAVARSGAAAWRELEQRGLADYVLCPQLAAGDRPAAVREIARGLNLALDATLIIGGERAEGAGHGEGADVTGADPEICRVGTAAIAHLIEDPRIGPSLVGLEPRPRRLIYREELARAAAERAFLAAAERAFLAAAERAASRAGGAGPHADLPGAAAPGGAAVAAPDGFLATLAPRLTIAPAGAADLPRLRELVNRANQRCATYNDGELARLCSAPERDDELARLCSAPERDAELARLCSAPERDDELARLCSAPARDDELARLCSAPARDDELARLCSAPAPTALLISLSDRFGDSGQVGAVVIERGPARWTVQLLQLSCRAQGRGIPDLVVGWILRQARAAGVALVTEVVPTSKNQSLLAMYQRAGFAEIERRGDLIVLAADPAGAPPAPPWLTVIAPGGPGDGTAQGAVLAC